MWGLILTIFLFFMMKKYNPLITTSLLIIIILMIFNLDFNHYYQSAQMLPRLLKPATVSLAIPLYKMRDKIKTELKLIISSITFGIIVHTICILILAKILSISKPLLISLIPKTITTPIAKELSSAYGGIPEITIALVILTGIFGAFISPTIFKIFKIKNKGLSLGVSAHAVGTSKAIEISAYEGTMASIALIVTGLILVAIMPVIMILIG